MRAGLVLLALAAVLGVLSAPAAARPATKITFYLGLDRPEAQARAAFAAVGDPGSPRYRRFLGVEQAGKRYGASVRTVSKLRRAARAHGLTVRPDRSRVFARVTGTVRAFERTLGVRIRKEFDNDVLANTWYPKGGRAARLPKDMRPYVREIVPVYARSTHARKPSGRRGAATRSAAATPQPGNAGTWTGGCAKAKATGSYSFPQVRTAYGLDAAGTGTGASIAILNVGEGLTKQDIAENAACFGLPAVHTRTLLTDGQARPFGLGSFEPQEDLALARGMAPGAASLTFAQVWLATQLWFLGPAQVLAARNLPDTLSMSYGECEPQVRGRHALRDLRAGASLMDAVLVRLGIVGVGVFSAAGDFGSTCNGQPFAGVAWPASSPYVTAVGGTRLTLDAANARVDEVVWNDLEWLATDNGGGAGGGGVSAISGRPSYQHGLNVPGSRRAVPDVSAHASMLPGWPVVLGRNWLEDAGTSSSTPLIAGAFAVLSANERAAGRPPLGPVNGLLYDLQASTPDTVFDVVSGANGYDPKVPGISAVPGYDRASGLGVPRFDRLAATLPPPAP